MTKLIKPPRFTPGSKGVAGTPGSPGSPPRPGYFIQEPYTIPARPRQYISFRGADPEVPNQPRGPGPTRAEQYQADYDARTTEKLSGILGVSMEQAAREYSGEADALRGLTNQLVQEGMPRPQAEQRAALMMTSEESRLYGPQGRPTYALLPYTPPSVGYRSVWVPPTPGIPPVAPVRAVPPTPGKEFGAAWDAGAMSVDSLAGDGELSFTVPSTAVGAVCGFSNFDTGAHYGGITHGIYVSHGIARPVESGVFVAPSVLMTSNELQIIRRGSVVAYKVNGIVCYTSSAPSYGAVFADAALFTATTDTIVDTRMEARDAAGAWGESHGGLAPLQTLAYAGAGAYMVSTSILPGLTSSSAGRTVTGATGVLPPLTGLASSRAYGASAAILSPLNGAAFANEIRPTFGLAAGVMATMSGKSTGKTGIVGQSVGRMARLTGGSSDKVYGEAVGFLRPLRGFSEDYVADANALIAALGGFTLSAWGTTEAKNGADLSAPVSSSVAFAGAYFNRRAPKAALVVTATVPIMGRATLAAPTVTLAVSGTMVMGGQISAGMPKAVVVALAGATGICAPPPATLVTSGAQANIGGARLRLRYPATLSGFAGAVLTQRLPMPGAVSSGSRAVTSSAGALQLPTPVVTASGVQLAFGSAELWAPTAQLFTTPNGVTLILPHPALTAVGGAALAPWGGPAGSAWAFGMGESERPGRRTERRYAASEYTNYPFMRIVRFGGCHYGISATGLYRLEGDTDDGEPVAWAVQTQVSDFGSSQLKAMPSAFFGAHMGPQATARAVVGEHGSHDYSYPNVRGTPIQNHRVTFGRGMRSRYYAVRLDDLAGGDLHLDNIEPEVIDLSRKR